MPHLAAPRLTIIDLPKDELSCVVRRLDQDDVAALRSVCRTLRHAVDVVVTHAAFHANVRVSELRSTFRRCPGLHTVQLRQLHPEAAGPTMEALVGLPHLRSLSLPLVEDMQLEVLTRLSSLTHLELRDTEASHDDTLAAVLPRLTALRSLALPDCFLAATDLHLERLSRLTHLDLKWASNVPAVAPQLPNLQSLTLRLTHTPAPFTSGPQVTALMGLSELSSLLPLTRLRRLSLAMGGHYREELTLCSDGTVLPDTTRTVGNAHGTAQCAILPLQGVCHLAALYGVRGQAALELVPWPQDAPFRRPPRADLLRAMSPCNTLRELRLFDYEVTADDVADLAAVAGRLRVLHLVGCRGAVAPLLQAAVVAEDVLVPDAQGGGELLAALRPAAGTLRRLNTFGISGHVLDPGAEHLAVLSGLTSLQYGSHGGPADDEAADGGSADGKAADGVSADAFDAISQLTRLRELILGSPSSFDSAQLAKLSTLRGLTRLYLVVADRGDLGAGPGLDDDQRALDVREGVAGSWLDAFAAARVPLRDLCWSTRLGCGTEAAIGRLTRLTSLQLSFDAALPGEGIRTRQQVQRGLGGGQHATLQLQLLGCSGAASAAGGGSAAARNTGLQELSLDCKGWLSDDELAAAAAALPDLRRLEVSSVSWGSDGGVSGLSGAGLAAYSACRRLRHISLSRCSDLEGPLLVEQLPNIESLASLQLRDTPRVAEEELQAAFQARHGRQLHLDLDLDPHSYL